MRGRCGLLVAGLGLCRGIGCRACLSRCLLGRMGRLLRGLLRLLCGLLSLLSRDLRLLRLLCLLCLLCRIGGLRGSLLGGALLRVQSTLQGLAETRSVNGTG